MLFLKASFLYVTAHPIYTACLQDNYLIGLKEEYMSNPTISPGFQIKPPEPPKPGMVRQRALFPITHKLVIRKPEFWGWRNVETPLLSPLVSWDGIAWGNGSFVAVSLSGHTMTSLDGITWTIHGNTPSLRGVVFGNGIFVGTGWRADLIQDNLDYTGLSNDHIWTSIDGITWSHHPIPAIPVQFNPWSISWSAPAFGNGVFVIVSRGHQFSSQHPPQTMAAYSTDSTTWILTPIPQLDPGSPGRLTHPTIPPTGLRNWTPPEYANGEFVVTTSSATISSAEGGFTIWRTIFGTSSNGMTWKEQTLNERVNSGQQRISGFIGHDWRFMYGNGIYVGIRGTGSHALVATSGNLLSGWTVQDVSHILLSISLSTFGSSRYAASDDFFVIMGGMGAGSQSIGSHNGRDWFEVEIEPPINRGWGATIYHDNAFVSVASGSFAGIPPSQVIRLTDWNNKKTS